MEKEYPIAICFRAGSQIFDAQPNFCEYPEIWDGLVLAKQAEHGLLTPIWGLSELNGKPENYIREIIMPTFDGHNLGVHHIRWVFSLFG